MPALPSPFELAAASRASLTWFECNQITAAARCLPGRWEVQWDRDDRGHVSVALLPDDAAPDAGTLLVWREDGRLCLGFGRDDARVGLGAYADVDDVMRVVQRRLRGARPRRR